MLTAIAHVTLPRSAALRKRLRAIRLVAFDFDGVFTDNRVWISEDGQESVCCTRADGIGLRKLDAMNIASIIVSTEVNPVVTARARKLGISVHQAVSDKVAALRGVASALNITLAETAFVGNDVNDEPALRAVGLPMVVADSHPDVHRLAVYRTRTPGGQGAVREICDLFEVVRRRTPARRKR